MTPETEAALLKLLDAARCGCGGAQCHKILEVLSDPALPTADSYKEIILAVGLKTPTQDEGKIVGITA